MTHIITSRCNLCRQCQTICPVECIVCPKDTSKFSQCFIDPETCIDCGACIPECPQLAILSEEEVTPNTQKDLQNNSNYFDKGPGYSDL